jgi:RNA polymerase sigma-70 factor, ECF subfamily
MPDTSDEELARQCQAGSLAGFEALVTRYEKRLLRFLTRCAGNEEDACELTQAIFVTAYRSMTLYHAERPFSAWLFTIARRKLIDYQRARRPTVGLESVPEPVVTSDPAQILADREDADQLWGFARARLTPEQFQAVWLRYQEGLSVKEVAQALGRTQTSVKVLLFRARQTLVASSLGRMRCAPNPPEAAPELAGGDRDTRGWVGQRPITSTATETK